ncbi:erythroblast NAD(P)(+)--arginine ADP-ribosyltransferase-like [Salvelinus alpinus]|uniref:erythroblast NAD(P)(+)--arginine ADP-ribosyltransferase-like n=1 Tax=Salvelinus alpinus TaxID=8036 RepID=UPI0039FBF1AD
MRRDNILTFSVLWVFHAWTPGVDSKMVSLPLHGLKCNIPLNMAPDSVDDSYKGCEEKMFRKVRDYYLPTERLNNKDFNQAWTDAEARYKPKPNRALSKIYFLAIQVYVTEYSQMYKSFNEATRTQKKSYSTTFKYHSLHFLLTNALRILNKKNKRFQTFRGTNVSFHGVRNTEMRFGQFTTSSLDKKIAGEHFGTRCCFEIITYFGAPLGGYSQLPDEKEVLIPPYEVFKITEVLKRKDKKDLWCDVVYKLESTKKGKSDLKCKMVGPLQGE